MLLHVTAWPNIGGVKRKPGDQVEVDDPALAKMLIREGQARPAGSPEPLAGGPDLAERVARVEAGLPPEPEAAGQAKEPAAGDPPKDDPAKEDPAKDGPPPKPGRGASHDTWVAYAIGQGMDHENAKAMTRAQLAAHFAGS